MTPMSRTSEPSPAQTMADAIVDGALLVETGRIAMLARQGLEDPTSLTLVQARQVFGAFLLLFDPLVTLRGEDAPPPLISRVHLPPPVSLASNRQAKGAAS